MFFTLLLTFSELLTQIKHPIFPISNPLLLVRNPLFLSLFELPCSKQPLLLHFKVCDHPLLILFLLFNFLAFAIALSTLLLYYSSQFLHFRLAPLHDFFNASDLLFGVLCGSHLLCTLPVEVIYLPVQARSYLYLAGLFLLMHVEPSNIFGLHQSISSFDFNEFRPLGRVHSLSVFVLADLCPQLLSVHMLLLLGHQLQLLEVFELSWLLKKAIVVVRLCMRIYHFIL